MADRPELHALRMWEALQWMYADPRHQLYHACAGYTRTESTSDGLYHAVDWFWQVPETLMSGVYRHYVLMDVSDPEDCLGSELVAIIGIFEHDDGEPGSVPSSL